MKFKKRILNEMDKVTDMDRIKKKFNLTENQSWEYIKEWLRLRK